MVDNPDSDGRYRDRPARTLAEWKKVQKACSTKYDFLTPIRPKVKEKRRSKFRQSEFVWNGRSYNGLTTSERCATNLPNDDNANNSHVSSSEKTTNQTCECDILQGEKNIKHKRKRKVRKR